MPRIEACAITAHQEKLWSDTKTALWWGSPGFAYVFTKMMDTSGSDHVALFTKEVPIAATDGIALMLNPDTFFKYVLKVRVTVVVHEILHNILGHIELMHRYNSRGKVAFGDGTSLPFLPMLMNVAMDLVVNDILFEARDGANKAMYQLDKGWLHDKSVATQDDSVIDVYRKLWKQSNGGKGPGTGGSNCSGEQFDEHLKPGQSQGKNPTQAASERNDNEWRTQVAAGAAVARAQGKLPAGLERLFGEILNPKVDWQDKIQALFARKVGSNAWDWRRAHPRLIVRDIYAPARSGYGAGTIVVAGDTSGSVGPKDVDVMFAELSGIFESLRPRRLIAIWCDAKVHRVDEVEEASDLNTIRCKGAPGGGGTSFVPVFEWVAKEGIEPDALVYLTDGMGTFPKPVTYPVIWGNISPPGSIKYPFGDVVDVPKQAA